MPAKHHLLGATAAAILLAAILLAAIVLAATSAEAAVTLTETFEGDTTFTSRSGSEYGVAEGRNGNDGGPSGDWEVGIGVPDTQTSPFPNANFNWQAAGPAGTDWELSYNDSNDEFSFSLTDGPSLTVLDVTSFGPATSLWIRADGRNGTSVSLTELELEGHALPDLETNGEVSYLGVSYADLDKNWTLTGNTVMTGFNAGSQPSFSIKVSDTSVVPLPAAAWLMLSGLAGVGYTAYRGRKRAAA